jgi:hypothetical protein
MDKKQELVSVLEYNLGSGMLIFVCSIPLKKNSSKNPANTIAYRKEIPNEIIITLIGSELFNMYFPPGVRKSNIVPINKHANGQGGGKLF